MRKFIVDAKVFEVLPHYCLGVVAAKGVDNKAMNARIEAMLDEHVEKFAQENQGVNVRELPNVKAYRDAFTALSMNPNKFMCSIEALTKRVQKGAKLPHINSVVDLGNALSVKYQFSMGAHDLRKLDADIEVRFSTAEDHFLPMGEAEPEIMPEGELVYVSGHTVKTRRWIWRQSDDGKITEDTCDVFFPIDGFEDVNREQVLQARDELAKILQEEFHCEVKTGYINKDENSFECE